MIRRIAIDLDGVVFDTIRRVCELYNEDFQYYDNFTPIKPEQINTWDFLEMNLATESYFTNIFCQPRFFSNLKIMDCAKWIIGMLDKEYEVIFVSKGNPANIKLKEIWLQKNLPYGTLIGVPIQQSKSIVDLSDTILIDDMSQNLIESNAKIKIMFGKVFPWNEDWNGIRCENWSEVYGVVKEVNKSDGD